MRNKPRVLTLLHPRNADTSLLTTCSLHKNGPRTYNPWSLFQRYTACDQFGKPRMFLHNYTSNKHDNKQQQYIFDFWGSVCSVRPSITQHYCLIAIHKTYWIPSHLNKIVNPEHIITNKNFHFTTPKIVDEVDYIFTLVSTCINRNYHPVPNVMCISAYRELEKVSQNHGGWLHYNMEQI